MPTNDSTLLREEFDETSLPAWRREVERLLKGAPFDRRMFSRTREGIDIGPMYTAADTADIPWLDSLPGQAPFVRGRHAGGYCSVPWLVSQEYGFPTAEEFNHHLRVGLSRGQTAVNLVFDFASKLGRDPDQAPVAAVGTRGTSIASLADLSLALGGVDLAGFPLILQAGGSALPALAMLVAHVRETGGDISDLSGCVGCDFTGGLARHGQITTSVSQIQDEMAVLTAWAKDHTPRLRTFPVFEGPWHAGGADLALSLGLCLSGAVAALRAMEERGLPLDVTAPRVQFNLEVGTDFFLEIAKLRALRLLWSRLLVASGLAPADTATFIHARTARRSQTVLDPHVNLLRATTEAMSAVLGGADSLHISPFDEVDRLPDAFSLRIARNLHLILAHECHFDQVADPAGGSWYVESLTRDLAAAAWSRFQAVEAAGGLLAALESGWAQEQVAAAAAARARSYATGRDVLVGANRYPAGPDVRPAGEAVDRARFHRERSDAVTDQRVSETREAHMLVLGRLERIMDAPPDEVFEALVAAGEAGATLGELASALRESSGPPLTVTVVPVRRDAEPFEKLRELSATVRAADPAAGRAFMTCLGDFARYMPRLEFARGFCQVGGLEVVGETFFAAPEPAAAAAIADGARTIVLVGTDETYAEQAAAVARLLAVARPARTVILAGAPDARRDEWRAAGVDDFMHLGCDALALLRSLLGRKEDDS